MCSSCSRNMPDVDALMEEWPPEFEELLKEVCSFILSRCLNVINISKLYHANIER